mgnify:FL=1
MQLPQLQHTRFRSSFILCHPFSDSNSAAGLSFRRSSRAFRPQRSADSGYRIHSRSYKCPLLPIVWYNGMVFHSALKLKLFEREHVFSYEQTNRSDKATFVGYLVPCAKIYIVPKKPVNSPVPFLVHSAPSILAPQWGQNALSPINVLGARQIEQL